MRRLLMCTAAQIALLTGMGYGQAGALVDLPKDPRTLLTAAAPYHNFDSADLKPWHLKASYQYYDSNGNPTGEGKWEYWWASPKVHRSTWTRNNATRTEWLTADGRFSKQDGGSLRYFERNISQTLLGSLPSETSSIFRRMKLELRMVSMGQMQLACVSATPQLENKGKLEAPPSEDSRVYCFNPSSLALRLISEDSLIYEYDQVVKTQERYLAKQVVIMNGNQKAFSVAIETIDEITSEDSSLVPPVDATLVKVSARRQTDNKNESDITVGSLVKKTEPDYPLFAKIAHDQGTVVLAAVVGTDGRIHDLEAIASPSPLLAKSAEDAVKKWEYKPYLLNGNPVEVEIMVHVNFTLSR